MSLRSTHGRIYGRSIVSTPWVAMVVVYKCLKLYSLILKSYNNGLIK